VAKALDPHGIAFSISEWIVGNPSRERQGDALLTRRRLIVPGQGGATLGIRYRAITVLLNDNRGSEQYHQQIRRLNDDNPAAHQGRKDC
jgi:hypothetical protein